MARDRNTFAKQQREVGKKRKAADKRARRRKKKEPAAGTEDLNRDNRPANGQ